MAFLGNDTRDQDYDGYDSYYDYQRKSKNTTSKNKNTFHSKLDLSKRSIGNSIKHGIIKSQRTIERNEKLLGLPDRVYYCSKCFSCDMKPCKCMYLEWCGCYENSICCKYVEDAVDYLIYYSELDSFMCSYHSDYKKKLKSISDNQSQSVSHSESQSESHSESQSKNKIKSEYPGKKTLQNRYIPIKPKKTTLATIIEAKDEV